MPHLIAPRTVLFSQEEVDEFRSSWPCNELTSRSYWFEFDQNGDLIDCDAPNEEGGAALLALSQEAQEYLNNSLDSPDGLRSAYDNGI